MAGELARISAKKRGILDRRAREMLMNVNEYFEKERDECKNILKTLETLLKANFGESEVVVSAQLLMDIIEQLKKSNRVTNCVVRATGVSKNTLAAIRSEKAYAVSHGTTLETPVRKPRGKIKYFDSDGLEALRNIIKYMYTVKKEVPTVNKLFAVAQQELGYKGCKTTLRRILIGDLGFSMRGRKPKQQQAEADDLETIFDDSNSNTLDMEDHSEEMAEAHYEQMHLEMESS